MKNVAIIQARLGSSRLPAKVLRDVRGRAMLYRVVRRVQECRYVDQVVVATSNESVYSTVVRKASMSSKDRIWMFSADTQRRRLRTKPTTSFASLPIVH